MRASTSLILGSLLLAFGIYAEEPARPKPQVISDAKEIFPVDVKLPGADFSLFTAIGGWSGADNCVCSSGQGREMLFPKQHSALKEIVVEATFTLEGAAAQSAGGLQMGFAGDPATTWDFLYFPSEGKLKFLFHARDSSARVYKTISIKLEPPYTLKYHRPIFIDTESQCIADRFKQSRAFHQ